MKKAKKTNFLAFRRGDRIRTCDHLVPNQERYLAALHPAFQHCQPSFLISGCKGTTFFSTYQTFYLFFCIAT